jgi:NAD(P)-dependent dehydrogenase (short-subunit alcohol dehydrogenase family)
MDFSQLDDVIEVSACEIIIWFSGHFLLTNLLLENMKETAIKSKIKGRIVILTSSYHKFTYPEGIRFNKINSSEG